MSEPTDLKAVLQRAEMRLVRDDRDAEIRAELAREAETELRQRRAAAIAGLPLRASVEASLISGMGLVPTRALEAVQSWWSRTDAPPVLVLGGGTGSGKTVASAWAMAEQMSVRSRWLSATQLARLWMQQFEEDALREQEIVRNCHLLIVDDIGREHDAARMCATLIELIDERQHSAARYRTIMSTNSNRAEFAKRYADERLLSRMMPEAGVVAWVGTAGDDMRLKGGQP